ncbi:MAG: hypothetical protein H7227_07665 [Actinobacteria bacterium]|nr:hypothetical protein [Actinomycetota bacterium]
MKDIHLALRKASIAIIAQNQAPSGAYVASPNFGVYKYSWFRDGAFIADAMSASGENQSALKFHLWATRVILGREEKIASLIKKSRQGEEIPIDDHLHCRYSMDGKEAPEEWTNFQLDGFGTWVWSLNQFILRNGTLPTSTYRAVDSLVAYMVEFWKSVSYDWWEESFGHLHVASLGSIAAGLHAVTAWPELSEETRKVAAETYVIIRSFILTHGLVGERLAKWIDGVGLDSSTISLIEPFRVFTKEDSVTTPTIQEVGDQLGILGTFRHVDDQYFGGGKWPLLSCFLGLSLIEIGRTDQAEEILDWVASVADEALQLPEQLTVPLLHPEFRDEWIKRWGEPAIPLLWSHAMYLSLLAALNTKR